VPPFEPPLAKSDAPASAAPATSADDDDAETPRQRKVAQVAEPVNLWQRMRADLSWQDIDNAAIAAERRRYLAQPDYLRVVANRANYYLYHIVEQVEAREFPMEIALLPLVESTLNPFASSSSRAAGLWQIIPGTGEHLGLQQDWWYDGRRDLRDSTRAALDYLEELNVAFEGDWLLALAAYNAGKARVLRTQARNAARGLHTDFWSLRLPRETRSYVPRLIALTQIISDPERYGVAIPAVANAPAFEIADTGGQLELLRAAELAGVELSMLRAFNPGHLRWATSPHTPPELLLPVGKAQRFEQAVATLTPDQRVRWQRYTIARGDTLIRIAQRFKTEVTLLREVNGIRGSRIRAGDRLMIPPGSEWAASLATGSRKGGQPRGYRVRRGDSLYRIAGKFNVSISDIIAWNELDPGQYLQPGQQLTLYVSGG
tara:strand:- start:581 stop:1873 length:1293 start_codon:yes stop_codon:yes gene_type:complete